MSLNVPLLRESFALVVEREPQVVHNFYEILFERHPQVVPLFRSRGRPEQEKMLTAALVAVMDRLEDAPWLERELAALGRKHVGYGVTPEMYQWVGASLLAALAKAAGEHWNADLEAAWTEAYGAITQLMMNGAEAPAAE